MPKNETLSPAAMRILAREDVTEAERNGTRPFTEARIEEILRRAGVTDVERRLNLKIELLGQSWL